MEVRRILVPTDFSEHANKAVDYAVDLAKAFDAEVTVMHAFHLAVPMAVPDPVVVPQGFWDDARKYSTKSLDEIKAKVESDGVTCHTHVSADPAFTAILDFAKTLPADLIVMGTRGLTGLKHVLLGSVAERTIRLAPCPVITVKADDEV